jgi:hypothetical protein
MNKTSPLPAKGNQRGVFLDNCILGCHRAHPFSHLSLLLCAKSRNHSSNGGVPACSQLLRTRVEVQQDGAARHLMSSQLAALRKAAAPSQTGKLLLTAPAGASRITLSAAPLGSAHLSSVRKQSGVGQCPNRPQVICCRWDRDPPAAPAAAAARRTASAIQRCHCAHSKHKSTDEQLHSPLRVDRC